MYMSGLGLCVVSTFLWSVDQELLFILPLSTNLPEVLYIVRPIVYKYIYRHALLVSVCFIRSKFSQNLEVSERI